MSEGIAYNMDVTIYRSACIECGGVGVDGSEPCHMCGGTGSVEGAADIVIAQMPEIPRIVLIPSNFGA